MLKIDALSAEVERLRKSESSEVWIQQSNPIENADGEPPEAISFVDESATELGGEEEHEVDNASAFQVSIVSEVEERVQSQNAISETLPPVKEPRPKRSFGSIEKVIGIRGTLIAGVISIIVGVGFFLKYAYDNNLLNPASRTFITIFYGIVILVVGEVTREKGFGIVARGVTALGFAVLFLADYSAFALYSLIPFPAAIAFASMIAIASMVYAMALKDELISLISLTGVYLAPIIMKWSGIAPYSLLIYLLLFSLGGLLCGGHRRWKFLLTYSLAAAYVVPALGIWGGVNPNVLLGVIFLFSLIGLFGGYLWRSGFVSVLSITGAAVSIVFTYGRFEVIGTFEPVFLLFALVFSSVAGVVVAYFREWKKTSLYAIAAAFGVLMIIFPSLIDKNILLVILFIFCLQGIFAGYSKGWRETFLISFIAFFTTPLLVGYRIMVVESGTSVFFNPHLLFGAFFVLAVSGVLFNIRRQWPLLNIVSFSCIVIHYAIWFFRHSFLSESLVSELPQKGLITGLFWLALFFLLYFALPVFNYYKGSKNWKEWDHIVIMANALFAGYFLYQWFEGDWELLSFIAVFLSILYIFPTYLIIKSKRRDKTLELIFLLTGIFFVTIAIPLYFRLHVIMIAWSIEGVILAFLGHRYKNYWVQRTAVVAWLLAAAQFIRLFTWNAPMTLFLSNLFFALASAIGYHLVYRFGRESSPLKTTAARIAYLFGLSLAIFLIHNQIRSHFLPTSFAAVTSTYYLIIMAMASLLLPFFTLKPLSPGGNGSHIISLLGYLAYGIYGLTLYTVKHSAETVFFLNPWFFGAVLLIASAVVVIFLLRNEETYISAAWWVVLVTLLTGIYLSFEIYSELIFRFELLREKAPHLAVWNFPFPYIALVWGILTLVVTRLKVVPYKLYGDEIGKITSVMLLVIYFIAMMIPLSVSPLLLNPEFLVGTVILVLLYFIWIKKDDAKETTINTLPPSTGAIVIAVAGVVLVTEEFFFHEHLLSVAWAFYAFLLVLTGTIKRIKALRQIAMGLFVVTILKIFIRDLRSVESIYRIVIFIGVGVFLIAVSYLYQRYFKKMLFKEEEGKP